MENHVYTHCQSTLLVAPSAAWYFTSADRILGKRDRFWPCEIMNYEVMVLWNIFFHLSLIGNRIVEIRRAQDRLISTMGFPILVRRYLYIETGPVRKSPLVYILKFEKPNKFNPASLLWIMPGEISQYHGCWCFCPLRHQAMSCHSIDELNCACAVSVVRNNRKRK